MNTTPKQRKPCSVCKRVRGVLNRIIKPKRKK